MTTMEQEALRRAQEMHSHTQRQKPAKRPEHPESKPETPPSKEEKCETTEQKEIANPLFADKEKLLILMLIMILGTEAEQDPALTLALLYLII